MTFIPTRNLGALGDIPSDAPRPRGRAIYVDTNPDEPVVLGVDPGVSGGVTGLSADGRRVLLCVPMPTVTKQGRRKRREVVPAGIQEIVVGLNVVRCYIEDPGIITRSEKATVDPATGKPRPARSAHSIVALREALSVVETVIRMHNIEPERVLPVHWKKPFGLLGHGRLKASARKRMSCDVAAKIWPDVFRGMRLGDDGQAEAALIALFGIKHVPKAR